MQELFKKDIVIDTTTLVEYFKGDLSSIGGISYLSELLAAGTIFDKSKVEIIKEKAKYRKLHKIILKAHDDIEKNKDFEEVFDEMQKALLDISNGEDEQLETDEDLFSKTFNYIDEQKGRDILGLKSDITDLDKALNGFQKGRLYIIAGRPGMGKSAVALNIVQNISKTKYVLYYSLEMTKEELGIRRLAMYSKLDSQKLERGQLNDKEWVKLADSCNILSRQKCITYAKAGIHINDIVKQAKKLKMQGKLDLLVVDHIGRLNLRGLGDSLREKITNVCIILKNLAMELDIPVIALSQLNRNPDARQDKRPSLSDLKESSGIEENADVILLLYRDEYYNYDSKDKKTIEVNIAKNRNGKTGRIKLIWFPEYQFVSSIYKEVV
ncbi:replicative DNA helicase [Caloramator sp. Dgby_cultured_2]|uniref:replicative DNA helicase n=1 Tax=Caloramator sp. Dgby_cultured_2 TaxID=3029174 RepID=UPI00237D773D|nr:DnaB-like helicase C-terminal domain-containing protein [Caloramator sp. Dgby_cultured_2]WDU82812.1 DnaB-like helicase C-terminal domain-containing protein [Caloramator sp. Dgby_cultured_2]